MKAICAAYPQQFDRDKYKRIRRQIAARLIHSGLHQEANEFAPEGLASSYGSAEPFDIRIRRLINSLGDLIRSLRSDSGSWRLQIDQGLERTAQRQSRVGGDYVNKGKIDELKRLNPLSKQWDLSGLIRLCEEINIADENHAFFSIAMLVRAVMDHVPPLFGQRSFEQVASHAPKSIKDSMEALYNSKAISHWALHNPIRNSVSLPSPEEVDVKNHVNFLLSYAIEKLNAHATTS